MSLSLKLALSGIAIVLLGGCFGERWEGFVYANKGNLANHVAIGEFPTLEECRRAALSTIDRISSRSRADYECGLNCKTLSGMTIKMCDRTER